jgi:hypothetical protein
MFEHKFPFYRMDVNGFRYIVHKAALSQCPSHDTPHEIKVVTMKALQEAFSNHAYWNEINNEKGELHQFLLEVCKPDDEEMEICCRHSPERVDDCESAKEYDDGHIHLVSADAPDGDTTPSPTRTPKGDTPAPPVDKKGKMSIFKL